MIGKEIADLNKELYAIEFTATGKTQDTNVRNCRYIVCSKDWYIAIGNDGNVTTQQEIYNYITKVINQKAHNGNKPVTLNAKEDTSYRMIQYNAK